MTPDPDLPTTVGRHHFRWAERKNTGWCADCHRSKDDPVHYTQAEVARAELDQGPAVCLCGHPEHPDHDTDTQYRICVTCQREDRHPAGCWGWFAEGSRAIEVDEHGNEVGPPDLRQAIRAATDALRQADPAIGLAEPWAKVARIAIEAAFPHATSKRAMQDVEEALAIATRRLDQADRNTHQAQAQVRWYEQAVRTLLPAEAEHLRHMTDGHWHDGCWYCLRRRDQGGTGIAALDLRVAPGKDTGADDGD